MEKYNAKIVREDAKASLLLEIPGKPLNIVLTEDKPNDVKNVFNDLLHQLKSGLFEFDLQSDKEDLFFFISKEYITQLNTELISVYNELNDYGLLKVVEDA
jgi:hypothetical protein